MTALDSDVIFVQEVARRDEGWLCEDSEHFIGFSSVDPHSGAALALASLLISLTAL